VEGREERGRKEGKKHLDTWSRKPVLVTGRCTSRIKTMFSIKTYRPHVQMYGL
jgi:hypothetical protein